MPLVSHRFSIDESPADAKARFLTEAAPGLERLGFKLIAGGPDQLEFVPTMSDDEFAGALAMSVFLAPAVLFWRTRIARENICVTVSAETPRTRVEIRGKAKPFAVADIQMLGTAEYWPNVNCWAAITLHDDSLLIGSSESWEGETVDPTELDAITRRALKKSGRLSR